MSPQYMLSMNGMGNGARGEVRLPRRDGGPVGESEGQDEVGHDPDASQEEGGDERELDEDAERGVYGSEGEHQLRTASHGLDISDATNQSTKKTKALLRMATGQKRMERRWCQT